MHGMNLDYFLKKLGDLKKAVLEAQAAQEAAEHAEDGAQNAEQAAQGYAQDAEESAQAAAQSAQDAQDAADSLDPASVLQDAKDYTDDQITDCLQESKNYTDQAVLDLGDTYASKTVVDEIAGRSPFKTAADYSIAHLFAAEGYTQNGCIIGDYVIVAYEQTDKFVSWKRSTGAEVVTSISPSGAYGHCNDMTADDDFIYLAPMTEDGKLYKFTLNNDGTIALAGTQTLRDSNNQTFNVWNIAYDRKEDRLVTVDAVTGACRFYDTSMVLLDTKPIDVSKWTGTRQGIETDGEYLYCCSFNYDMVFVYDLNTLDYVGSFSLPAIPGEPEGLIYDWTNQVMLASVPTWADGTPHGQIMVLDYKTYYEPETIEGLRVYDPHGYSMVSEDAAYMLNASQKAISNPDTIVRIARKWFGTEVKVKAELAGHFMVLVNHQRAYQGWIAGNPPAVNLTQIFGSSGPEVTAAIDNDGNLVITATAQCGLSVLYTSGVML